jgi:malate permease and related proteins
MGLFLDILTRVTLPIIALATLGFCLQSWLKLDIGTLTRLQVNVVMPAFLIHFLSTGKQPLEIVWLVAGLAVVQFMILIPLGWLMVVAFRLRPTLGPIMGLGTAYANVGFFGIPVTQLAFGSEYLLHQSVLTAMMTILVCTLGVWLLSPSGGGIMGKFKTAFETPLIPAVALGLGLRYFEVELPPIASQPLQLLGAIFTPLALYTLGAQIASAKSLRFEALPQAIILALKLAVSPVITLYLCRAMGVPPDVTGVMVVAAATPVGVLITIFAAELKAEPEFIATATVLSTALSPLTVTAWIIAVRLLQ